MRGRLFCRAVLTTGVLVLGGCEAVSGPPDVKDSALSSAIAAASVPTMPGSAGSLPPTATPQDAYNSLLVRAYGDLAAKAFREMDWVDGYRFNKKAELAARAQRTDPDTPESRSIAVARDLDIRRAYVTLRNYLKPENFGKSPEQIALAQAAYDCWVEDSEESSVEMREGLCRKQFEEAIRKIENAVIDDALDTIEAPVDPQQGQSNHL